MAVLLTPPLDEEPWPTLGPGVCDFIEAFGCYGPGDVAGQSYEITTDFRAQLYRAYEVYPKGHRLAGRRRFKQTYFEERKGTAKTERAMLIALAEAHPDGPVRCDGFDAHGDPVGRGLQSPYIPLVSFSVEQTEDLGFNVLRFILEHSELGDDFDIGLERIIVLDDRGREAGKIVPLAGSPNSRDGARTTHQHFDEPHRMTLPRLKRARSTMVENTYKRVAADAWTNYTSTAGEPGEESVAEDMRAYALQVLEGKIDDPRLLFFSRFAPDDMPMDTPADVRAFLVEASGPNAAWSGDIDALVSRWFEPDTDRNFYRRVWGNQWVEGSNAAFDPIRWAELAAPEVVVPQGELITLGFDGARRFDATALIGTVIETGHQFDLGIWERPAHAPDDWEVDEDDVEAAVALAFERYEVWRLYGDPPYWESALDRWAARYGERRVFRWWTNRPKQMAYALSAYRNAMLDGELSHDGSTVFTTHVGHARRKKLPHLVDDQDQPMWVLQKDQQRRMIDAAMAGCLSWEARGDALSAGVKKRKSRVVGF